MVKTTCTNVMTDISKTTYPMYAVAREEAEAMSSSTAASSREMTASTGSPSTDQFSCAGEVLLSAADSVGKYDLGPAEQQREAGPQQRGGGLHGAVVDLGAGLGRGDLLPQRLDVVPHLHTRGASVAVPSQYHG